MDEALRFSQSHGVRAGCQALDLPPRPDPAAADARLESIKNLWVS